ncbi:hypothetical protein ANCDUO_06382, partial [Ancylostoma duodenale]
MYSPAELVLFLLPLVSADFSFIENSIVGFPLSRHLGLPYPEVNAAHGPPPSGGLRERPRKGPKEKLGGWKRTLLRVCPLFFDDVFDASCPRCSLRIRGTPKVMCEDNDLALDIVTEKPFQGNIFVKSAHIVQRLIELNTIRYVMRLGIWNEMGGASCNISHKISTSFNFAST